tara:strand:- start:4660 stop:6486 length:1827 start_codon:yes stop_codon:yes gene_type:complete
MNYDDFSSFLNDTCKTNQESQSVKSLLHFCSIKFGKKFDTKQLGLWEFNEFIQLLSLSKTETSTYNSSTVARRFCRELEKCSTKFKTSAANWRCPPKPDISHFNPLSRDEYQTLCSYLEIAIGSIRERLSLIDSLESHQSSVETTGRTFSLGEKSFYKYQTSLSDVLSSLIQYYPDFPIDAENEAYKLGGRFWLNTQKVDYASLDNPVKFFRKRFVMQRIRGVLPALWDYPQFGFEDILNILAPNEEEAAAIRKAICLETGWSPDLVARIDPRDFTFQDLDPNSDYVFIKTTKVKGTQTGNDYLEAKSMFAPSSKSQSDSAYNLILLWLERTASLRQSKSYSKWVDQLGFEPFFIFRSDIRALHKQDSLRVHHPENPINRNNSAINRVSDQALGFRFDERQLRPTHLYFRAKDQDIPLALLVALFGHSSSAITEEFYQNGSHFEQDRKDKLSLALSEINESIADGSFAGKLIPLKEKKTIQDKIYTIFSDHSNQNPIAVCSDPYNPSWLGHKNRVKLGSKCMAFNKCLLCSKSQVFSDNLPFVVDRYLYLEKKKRTLRDDQFFIYLAEYTATKSVVNSWPYQTEVDEAKERTFLEGHLLPPVILGDVL